MSVVGVEVLVGEAPVVVDDGCLPPRRAVAEEKSEFISEKMLPPVIVEVSVVKLVVSDLCVCVTSVLVGGRPPNALLFNVVAIEGTVDVGLSLQLSTVVVVLSSHMPVVHGLCEQQPVKRPTAHW